MCYCPGDTPSGGYDQAGLPQGDYLCQAYNMNKKLNNTWQTWLLDMRNGLIQDSDNTIEDRKPVGLDQTAVGRLSRMDALQVQAMQIETNRRRHVELKRIESALSRLKDAEFGYCIICGEEIEDKRLNIDPTVPNCIACSRNSG